MKFAATAALLALASLAISCGRSSAPKTSNASKPREVRVARVEARPMERVLAVTGALAAHEQAVLSVKVPGRLERMEVDLGTVVRRGALLAQIESRDYELRMQQSAAALARARAAVGLPLEGDNDRFTEDQTSLVREGKAVLDEATHNRARVQSLSKSGISSQADLDTADAAYNIALNRFESAREEVRRRQAELAQRRAEHDIARQQLDDTAIRAPFDGAVQERNANIGEFLNTGAPVITFLRTDPLRLRLEVPEREAAPVRTGQAVRLRVEGIDRVHAGRLARLSPGIRESNRVLLAEADIPNDGVLRPGLFARAEIVLRESEPVLAVPADALIVFAGLEKVIVVKEGKARETIVATGRRSGAWVEITSGVAAGDTVVLQPGNLRTGEGVSIIADAPVTSASRRSAD